MSSSVRGGHAAAGVDAGKAIDPNPNGLQNPATVNRSMV